MRLVNLPVLSPRVKFDAPTIDINPEAVASVESQPHTADLTPWAIVTLRDGRALLIDASSGQIAVALTCDDVRLVERGK